MSFSRNLFSGLLILTALLGAVAAPEAIEANDGCCGSYSCCNNYGWLWGALLGAGAGAAAGYAAGHDNGHRGKKGRDGPTGPTGPIGPTGPTGPSSFPENITEELVITGENTIIAEATSTIYTLWITDPVGTPIFTLSNVDSIAMLPISLVNIPPATPKLEGTYSLYIQLQSVEIATATTLGTFMLNGMPMTPISMSRDPTSSEMWVEGETLVLTAEFPTP